MRDARNSRPSCGTHAVADRGATHAVADRGATHAVADPLLERITSLRNTVMEKLENTRIKPLVKNATKAETDRIVRWSDALDELGGGRSARSRHT